MSYSIEEMEFQLPRLNGTASPEGQSLPEKDIIEPIAVVGMSLKFPQDAVSEESLWEMLMEKRCASTEFPEDRINANGFHSSDPNKHSTVKHA